MKACIRNCGFVGSVEDFPRVGRGRRSGMCRDCKRAYDNAHYRDRRDKEQKLRRQVEWMRENRQRLGEFLADKSCEDCGNNNKVVLDFDHREGEEKKGNIADLVNRWCWDRLEGEIAKCDIVCANCHRIRTWERAGGTSKMPV